MEVLSEKWARELGGIPVNSLLDLWHELCREVLGLDIEVLIADPRDLPEVRSMISGTVFGAESTSATAVLTRIGGGPLSLLVSMPIVKHQNGGESVNDIVYTHELCHWILRLKGFLHVKARDVSMSFFEALVNDAATHPAIHDMQRSHALDVARDNLESAASGLASLPGKPEPNGRIERLTNAFYVCEHFLTCDRLTLQPYEAAMRFYHPQTWKLVNKMLRLAKPYSLSTPPGSSDFLRAILESFDLSSTLFLQNDIDIVTQDIERARGGL